MSTEGYIIIGLAALFIIGFFRIRFVLKKLNEKLSFLNDYRTEYIALANSVDYTSGFGIVNRINTDLYNWLTHNSFKAQTEVGIFGISDVVSPVRIRNYQVIVNTLPLFRNGYVMAEQVGAVEDVLTRCIGYHNEIATGLSKDLKNPIKWFQYGFRLLIGFPLYLLNWFGIINENTLDSITSSGIFKFLAGIFALIGFISSVIGIITGWEAFIKIVGGWF